MTHLNSYGADGSNHQARAVLAYLQAQECIAPGSWSAEHNKYMATIGVSRWENCREQGYVVSMSTGNGDQLNIAFFEHRNSDSICAVRWEQLLLNAPTIDTAQFGDVYKDKYDVSHETSYGHAMEMAAWIGNEFDQYWNEKHKPEKS